jgi:hypothetical protein
VLQLNSNPSDVISKAEEHGFGVYEDFIFMRSQLIVLALAGIYHLWERLIKRFIRAEFKKDNVRVYDDARKKNSQKDIVELNFNEICDVLSAFGFPIKEQKFYLHLNQLRLVANVSKHGDRKSRNELFEILPEVANFENTSSCALIGFEYDDINVNERHFFELSEATIAFREAMPERLFAKINPI